MPDPQTISMILAEVRCRRACSVAGYDELRSLEEWLVERLDEEDALRAADALGRVAFTHAGASALEVS